MLKFKISAYRLVFWPGCEVVPLLTIMKTHFLFPKKLFSYYLHLL